MPKTTFTSINTYFQAVYYFIIYFIIFTLSQAYKDEITVLHVTIAAAAVIVATILIRPLYTKSLEISSSEIVEKNEKTKKVYWRTLWADVEEVRLIHLAMNQHILRIKSSNGIKDITVNNWIIKEPKVNFRTIRKTLLSLKTPIDSTELFQSINRIKHIISDGESKESAAAQNEAMDLGTPAGYMAYTALGFVCISIAMMFISKSHILEPGLIYHLTYGTTLLVFVICGYVSVKSKKALGSIITGILLTACTYPLCYSSLKAINVIWGVQQIKTFELTKKSGNYQIWATENNIALTIYAEINEVKYRGLYTKKPLLITQGPFNIVSMPMSEIKTLIK